MGIVLLQERRCSFCPKPIPPPVFQILSPATYSGTRLWMVTSLLILTRLLSTQVLPSTLNIHTSFPFWKEIKNKNPPSSSHSTPSSCPSTALSPCLSNPSGRGYMDMPSPCPYVLAISPFCLSPSLKVLPRSTMDLNPFSGTAQQPLTLGTPLSFL